MSKEIIVEENKVLKLKNVIAKTIILEDNEQIDKVIHMLESYIKNNAYTPFGPLVIYSSIKSENNQPKLLLKAMMQVKESDVKIIPPYEFLEEIKTTNCLYSRYIGLEETSAVAQSKMQVYAYENDLILDTKSYCVFKDKEDNILTLDTFIPIIGKTGDIS